MWSFSESDKAKTPENLSSYQSILRPLQKLVRRNGRLHDVLTRPFFGDIVDQAFPFILFSENQRIKGGLEI